MRCDVLSYISFGGLAQLVRASASHAEGRRFESATLHHVRRSQVHSASANMAKAPFILSPSSSPKRISIDSFWYYGVSCRARTAPPRQSKVRSAHKPATQNELPVFCLSSKLADCSTFKCKKALKASEQPRFVLSARTGAVQNHGTFLS